MFFTSFDSNEVFEVIWQISGNGLLKITRYTGLITMNEAAHAISLISQSKSSSGSSRQQWFNILHFNKRETRFASGMERDRSDVSRSIRQGEIFEPQPGNFGAMDCTKNSALASQTMNLGFFYDFKQRNTVGSVWGWKTKDLKFVFRYLHFYLSYKRVLASYGNFSFKSAL